MTSPGMPARTTVPPGAVTASASAMEAADPTQS